MKLGDATTQEVEVIPTGCLTLDMALGVGGIPRGRIVEIYGPESSGKTTVSLHIVAEAQKMGGTAAFIDAEHALDPIYAQRLGVDIKNLYVSQPDTGEQGLEIAESLGIKVVGFDMRNVINKKVKAGNFSAISDLMPVYLRASQAEIEREKKNDRR